MVRKHPLFFAAKALEGYKNLNEMRAKFYRMVKMSKELD